MRNYLFQIFLATGYEYGKGWQFNGEGIDEYAFDDAGNANNYYSDRLQDKFSLAAMFGTAVRIRLSKDGEILQQEIYEGENVRGWYAAYHKPADNPIEERYYIDRVYFDAGYYNFMYQKEQNPEVLPVAAAANIEELREILGDTFDMYDVLG